jgi:hypothetical protein
MGNAEWEGSITSMGKDQTLEESTTELHLRSSISNSHITVMAKQLATRPSNHYQNLAALPESTSTRTLRAGPITCCGALGKGSKTNIWGMGSMQRTHADGARGAKDCGMHLTPFGMVEVTFEEPVTLPMLFLKQRTSEPTRLLPCSNGLRHCILRRPLSPQP